MNRFCSMSMGLIALTEASAAGAADQIPNTPPNPATKMAVMRQRAIRSTLLSCYTIAKVEHPVLGSIALAQPLLSSVILARISSVGEDEEIDDLLSYMIKDAGADCNIPSSIGLTPLHIVVAYFIDSCERSDSAPDVLCCVRIVRELLLAGADSGTCALSFGKGRYGGGDRWGLTGLTVARVADFLDGVKMGVRGEECFTPLDVLLEASSKLESHEAFAPIYLKLKGLLEGAAIVIPKVTADQEAPLPLLRGRPRIVNVPWSHACFNILWSSSQVAASRNVGTRRRILSSIRARAPFTLPAMTVVSLPQLKELGKIPRFSTQDDPAVRFKPIPVEAVGPNGLVVFLSHRWLGNGCPDDDKGTKIGQVYQIANELAVRKGRSPDDIFFWIDYSVCDQSNPMPGVQMLPVYIACCDAFIWCDHPQYDQRAWCLTEQFMFWKLSGGGGEDDGGLMKMCLRTDGRLEERAVGEKPRDPSLGQLAFEGDRVALATMVSILPYD